MFTVPDGYILIKKEEYENLLQTIRDMSATIVKLTARIDELESQQRKNSSNSHKPPSSDMIRSVIKNNREKSGKKPGAQPGHKGTTLELSNSPDEVIQLTKEGFCECGEEIGKLAIKGIERRQTIELPEKLTKITEYRLEVKECKCGRIHKSQCPQTSRVGYGNRFKSLMVYLNQFQMMPFERIQDFSKDCLGISISDGVLEKSNETCYKQLEETEKEIKEGLLSSELQHVDETSLRTEGKKAWVHSCSNESLTHYSISSKRGKEGIDEKGILPNFHKIIVHDRWSSYDQYDCIHALCNAHLLRDLKFVHEEMDKKWAKRMIEFLLFVKDKKEKGALIDSISNLIEKEYQNILEEGLKEEPPPIDPVKKKRGRKAKTKSLKLLEVFINRKEDVLRFMNNPIVPFDNNMAERDLRMIKLKQKVSGCFRKKEKAEAFCRIRSYISSVRKQGYSVMNALNKAMQGHPLQLFPVLNKLPC